MSALQVAALLLVMAGAPAVVATREPRRQAVVAGIYGLALAVLFFALQAPDVALSQITVGTIALPAMVLLAASKVRDREEDEER